MMMATEFVSELWFLNTDFAYTSEEKWKMFILLKLEI